MEAGEEREDTLKEKLFEFMETNGNIEEEAIRQEIDRMIKEEMKKRVLSVRERALLKKTLCNAVFGLDILEPCLDDPDISEIMVDGYEKVYVERRGKLERLPKKFIREEILDNIIQQIVSRINRQVNESSPIVDARLKDGSRVNIVLPPIALDGPSLTIRKFSKKNRTMDDLIRDGSITKEAADYLKTLVKAKYNLFICGGTGSGKTTLLNCLSEYIGRTERVITIEDSAELSLTDVPNIVRMETRNASEDGVKAITIRDLIRNALRMRPDRLIIGEVRGAEALDMLQAMNTGHDGSLSTGHANSAQDMLRRLEIMVLMAMSLDLAAVRGQIASAIDCLIQVGRLRDGSRKVLSIEEVLPMENGEIRLRPLFLFKETEERKGKIMGSLVYQKNPLLGREKLERAGLELYAEKKGVEE